MQWQLWGDYLTNLTGTVYTDEGHTTMGAGRTVSVSINGGAAAASTTTASDGTYSFSGINLNSGDIVTLYLDNDTEKGVTVDVATGLDQTGLDLYQNHLITRCDNSCSLTNANLSTAAGNGDADISSIYTVDSSVLNVKSGKALYIASNTFNPGNTVNVGSGITINGTFITNGVVTLSGSWLKKTAGNFNLNSSLVKLNGTNQTLSGSTTFNSLTKIVTTADTLTFAATTTQTIQGTLTLQGAAGNLLSLRSSKSGVQWKINPLSTRTLSYVDVKDSNNTNATSISCSSNCTDSGNNTKWTFPISTTTTLTSSANPIASGSTLTLTGTVSPSTATGTLTFKDGSTSIGTATLSHGSGSISVSNLNAGSHSLTVVYGGNSTYATSTSSTLTQKIAGDISSVTATPSDTGATITWTTNVAGDTSLEYGPTSSYGSQTSVTNTSPRVTSHSATISGLASCVLYHYEVLSTDASSITMTGSDLTFTTTGCVSDAPVKTSTGVTVAKASTGTVTLVATETGHSVDLVIPPAATVQAAPVFQVKQLDATTYIADIAPPSGQKSIGAIFNITALSGATANVKITSFAKPITVTLHYTDSDVAGLDESSIWIYRYDSPSWHALDGCTVDTVANVVTCTTTNFSDFSLFVTTPATTTTTTSTNTSGGGGGGGRRGVNGDVAIQNVLENMNTTTHSASSTLQSIVSACATVPVPALPGKKLGKLFVVTGSGSIVFNDIPVTSWFAPYIGDLAVKGIVSGYEDSHGNPNGTFAPDKPVSIAEVIKMAMVALQSQPTSSAMPTNHSAQMSWVAPYAARAEELKLSFMSPLLNVNAFATRAETIEILVETAGLTSAETSAADLYSDVPSGSASAAAIEEATRKCWISGDTAASGSLLGTFRPGETINRSEVAKIISRILALRGK